MTACGLMARTVASTAASSSAETRSVLFRQHNIGKSDLVFGLAAVLQAQWQMLGIDQGNDGIQGGFAADIVIHEEGLCHRNRIGKALSSRR